jgi:hypothetical protein
VKVVKLTMKYFYEIFLFLQIFSVPQQLRKNAISKVLASTALSAVNLVKKWSMFRKNLPGNKCHFFLSQLRKIIQERIPTRRIFLSAFTAMYGSRSTDSCVRNKPNSWRSACVFRILVKHLTHRSSQKVCGILWPYHLYFSLFFKWSLSFIS